MFRYLFLFLAIAALVYLVFRSSIRITPEQLRRYLRNLLIGGGIVLVVVLAATGRLHWLFALLAAMVPFVQRLLRLLAMAPLLQRAWAGFQQMKAARGPGAGRTSRIETRFLRMTLEHDTGALDGEVLQGAFAGRRLGQLGMAELVQLWQECRGADDQSVAVLEAYLDRSHGPDWRDAAGAGGAGERVAASGPMTTEEAFQVLGLEPGASRDEVVAAHRRLMQKLHPDRGGSSYLAAKINQAKDKLLEG